MKAVDTENVRRRLLELKVQCLALGLKASVEGESVASYGPGLKRRSRAIHRLGNILAGRPLFS